MLTALCCANRRSGHCCWALRVHCVYCLFNREAAAFGVLFLLLLSCPLLLSALPALTVGIMSARCELSFAPLPSLQSFRQSSRTDVTLKDSAACVVASLVAALRLPSSRRLRLFLCWGTTFDDQHLSASTANTSWRTATTKAH